MKYAIIIPDGCADCAIESLDGLTPLQAAHTPNMDALAATGILGRSKNVPPNLAPGSDVATLSLLGYDPMECFTGRAPLEAAAQGIELTENDWAFRCNLVSISNDRIQNGPQEIMQSFTAGHISTEEAAELLKSAQEALVPLCKNPIRFYSGVGYRNLLVFSEKPGETTFSEDTKTSAPHDYSDKPIEPALPQGPGREELLFLMNESRKVFVDHPVNRRRMPEGKLPATQCWLWGQGKKPRIKPFATRFQSVTATSSEKPFRGAMITAVDLLRGIGKLLAWNIIDVPGITGYVDTDYAAKGQYAINALKEYDLVCVHVEAPDEAGHEGAVDKKVLSLEEIDAKIVGPVVSALREYGHWRVLVSPDHPTPIHLKTHTHGAVPWVIAGSDADFPDKFQLPHTFRTYDEIAADASPLFYEPGWTLMEDFLKASR